MYSEEEHGQARRHRHKLEPVRMDWNLSFAVASDHDNMGIVQKLGSFITELNIQSGSRI